MWECLFCASGLSKPCKPLFPVYATQRPRPHWVCTAGCDSVLGNGCWATVAMWLLAEVAEWSIKYWGITAGLLSESDDPHIEWKHEEGSCQQTIQSSLIGFSFFCLCKAAQESIKHIQIAPPHINSDQCQSFCPSCPWILYIKAEAAAACFIV